MICSSSFVKRGSVTLSPMRVVTSTTHVGGNASRDPGLRTPDFGSWALKVGSWELSLRVGRGGAFDQPVVLWEKENFGRRPAWGTRQSKPLPSRLYVSVVPMISWPFGNVIATRRPRVVDEPRSVDSCSVSAGRLGSERKNSASRWTIDTNFVSFANGVGETCRYGRVGLKSFV